MPFIGNKPASVPLTSADIADSIITSAKIVDGTIASVDLASNAVDTQLHYLVEEIILLIFLVLQVYQQLVVLHQVILPEHGLILMEQEQ
jgi:hypothetical protein